MSTSSALLTLEHLATIFEMADVKEDEDVMDKGESLQWAEDQEAPDEHVAIGTSAYLTDF